MGYFGLELLFRTVKDEIRDKADILAVFFHWLLIRDEFKCVGLGGEVSQSAGLLFVWRVTHVHFY